MTATPPTGYRGLGATNATLIARHSLLVDGPYELGNRSGVRFAHHDVTVAPGEVGRLVAHKPCEEDGQARPTLAGDQSVELHDRAGHLALAETSLPRRFRHGERVVVQRCARDVGEQAAARVVERRERPGDRPAPGRGIGVPG